MKLFILYNEKSPYEYSDYPSNDDNWADIEYIATSFESLFNYVNQCRRKSVDEFRRTRKYRLDIDDDNPNFDWTGSRYHVMTVETDQQVDIDTREAFKYWMGHTSTFNIYTMKEFFHMAKVELWRPDPESVKKINELIGKKDEDIEDKVKKYKELKQELYDRGYLDRVDG